MILRRLIAAGVFIFALAGLAQAQVTLDTGASATCAGSNTDGASASCSLTTSAANETIYIDVITVAAEAYGTASVVTSSGCAGVTWTLNFHQEFGNLGNGSFNSGNMIDEYYGVQSSAGPCAVTVSNAGIGAFNFDAIGWAVTGATAQDANGPDSTSNNISATNPTISGTTASSLFIHVIAMTGTSGLTCAQQGLSAGSGMTQIRQGSNAANNYCDLVEYKTIATAGAYTAGLSGTWSNGGNGYGIVAKGIASSPPPPPSGAGGGGNLFHFR